ncbi:hypothetical protein TorRG33x02_006200 [Trema orientale]|uniref:Uncharacterized protein n=1 Tax=Trema orientale TaxID=63057 RepID=A0A2P5G047_TREOI|nr:hypothetical protein TorRG33x02_006200 [Trema orientale]
MSKPLIYRILLICVIRIYGCEIVKLLREVKSTNRVLKELRGVVEIGELDCLHLDGVEEIGRIRGKLEGGDNGSDGGESVIDVLEGGELREKLAMAGEDLSAEMRLEKTDGIHAPASQRWWWLWIR